MTSETTQWHKLMPFVALAPMVLVKNGSLISLGIVVLTLIAVSSSRGPTLAFRGPAPIKDVALGIGTGVILWVFSHFIMDPGLERVFGRIDLDSFSAVRGNFGNYLALLALGLVYGGMFEELINRGFVIGWGTALFGERAAVPLLLVSSVVFGVAHGYQDWAGMISTGVSGLVFGIVYLAARRKLLAPMLAHAVADATGISCLYLGFSS